MSRRTPLTPVLDNEVRRGSITIGNTPGTPVLSPPSSIGDLFFWFDASETSSIVDTAGVIDNWFPILADPSLSGGSLQQFASSNKPSTGGSVNGRNAVVFDHTNSEVLSWSGAGYPLGFSSAGPYTLYAVAVTTDLSGIRPILGGDYGNGVSRVLQFRRNGTGMDAIGFNNSTIPFTDNSGSGLVTSGVPHVYEAISTGTTLEAKVDGAGNGATAGTQRTNGSGVFLVGAEGGGVFALTGFWTGLICEIASWTRALTPSEEAALLDYWTAKWVP